MQIIFQEREILFLNLAAGLSFSVQGKFKREAQQSLIVNREIVKTIYKMRGYLFIIVAVAIPYIGTAQAPPVLWQRTLGGAAGDYLEVIQQTKDRGYIAGGHSGSGVSGDKTEPSQGGQDYW